MKITNLFICLVVVLLFLISTSFTFAQDWPQWRGDNRDGKVIGFIAPQNWPEGLTLK